MHKMVHTIKLKTKYFILLILVFFGFLSTDTFAGRKKVDLLEENRHYLAVFPNKQSGIEVIEHPVKGNGDCGFYVLGVSRGQLVKKLLTVRDNKGSRQFLAPEIRHAFLSDEIPAKLRPSKWAALQVTYEKTEHELEKLMLDIKSNMTDPYPKELDLKGRVQWLLKKMETGEEEGSLRQTFTKYEEANERLDKFCQRAKTFEHYVKLYEFPKTVWLGYKSALLWARLSQTNLHIWRESKESNGTLEPIDEHTSSSPLNTIHMLHTSGFTHFNLLEEKTKRDLRAERKLIRTWNKTEEEFPTDLTLFELFEQQARKSSKAVAIVSQDKELSYAQVYSLANKVGRVLLKYGATPNHLVGILMEKGWEQVVGSLGILVSGAAFLPLDPHWPESRLQQVLEVGKVKLVLTQQSVLENLSHLLSSYKCFSLGNEKEWSAYSEEPLLRQQSPEDIAYVIFTSGSTGEPKGVVLNHQSVVNTLFDINRRFRIGVKDCVLALSNLTFDLSIYDIFGVLASGGSIVLPNAAHLKDPDHWVKIIQSHHITIWNTVPMFMQMLVEYLDQVSSSKVTGLAKTLRVILLSGDWIPLNLPEKIRHYFSESQITSLGGATEGSIWSILYPIDEVKSTWKSIPYGRPMANQNMFVLDRDLNHCPMGILGDIYIGGKGVALGYWRDKKRTAASFIIHPLTKERLYRTGDMGRWNPEGYIEFVGRTDTQVKVGGYRIELGDVETALSQHPSVKQCVASVHEKGPHSQLAAFVVPQREFLENLDKMSDHTKDWATVYEDIYQTDLPLKDPTFNIAGWKSSYTGKLISIEEMREWVDHTVERILSLKPTSVLEIGCGTGLLVSRLASFCKTYVATDISKASIHLIEQLKGALSELKHVITLQRPADDFSDLDSFSFDTVVINSVTQCFPSAKYLMDVIKKAIALLPSGGRLFVGDIRNLALLKSYFVSLQLNQASDHTKREEFSQKVQSSMDQEEELLIDPRFFQVLKREVPRIQNVLVQLKRGSYHNELTRFRYDAILEVGEELIPLFIPAYEQWTAKDHSLLKLEKWLSNWVIEDSHSKSSIFALKEIPNARLQRESLALEWMEDDSESQTLGDLRESETKKDAIDPEALYQLEKKLGIEVLLTWNTQNPTFFNAVFTHHTGKKDVFALITDGKEEKGDWESFTNYPLLVRSRHSLISILKKHCQNKLPPYMVPLTITFLNRLPLSSNGKVDRKALPAPSSYQHSPENQSNPQSPHEKTLAKLWGMVLGIEKVSLEDDFFALGGSSLLAVQLMMKVNDAFKTSHPVSSLFTHPTLKQFAELFEDKEGTTGPYRPLLAFNEEGTHPPLFFVHSGRGGAEAYVTFASYFDENQPVYVVESYNLYNDPPFLESIEKMAKKYLTYVRAIQPGGPYYLGGWSQGGLIAFEMAQELLQEKEEVKKLYFLDTFLFTKVENAAFRTGIEMFLKKDPFYKQLPMPYRDHVKDVDRVQTLAMINYKPTVYAGEVVLLKASEFWPFLDTPEFEWSWVTRKFMHHAFSKKYNGWSKYALNLKIYPVPGHHQSIMEGTNAQAMAKVIQQNLLSQQKPQNNSTKKDCCSLQ